MIVLIALPMAPSRANETESVRLSRPALTAIADNQWMMDADVQVTLNSVLIDALKRGVSLVFVAELDISRKRWYWFNEKLLGQIRSTRLSYHAVTQQFRVSLGEQQILASPYLDEALAAALNVRQWPLVAPSDMTLSELMQQVMKNPDGYEIRFRTRLDSGQLPRPLQVNALTNRDWNLSTDWVKPRLMPQPSGQGQ